MTSIPPFLAKIDSLQQQIADHGDWDEEVRKRIAYKFRLDWNYHSQSIEGGTLTRRETRTIMVGQVDVHGKPLKDVLEMTQHNEVIQEIMAVGKGQKRLSESRIRQIHGAIMHEEDQEKRKLLGTWKTQPNEIFNHKREKFEFTSPADVPGDIHDLLNRTNANWDKLERDDNSARHPVLMALDFHLEFLTIHPFYDGNGRTARILLNLILISFGYPAIIVKNEDKEAYGRYIAEIQGYGAGRELYYEFMSGLLIRSQELVLQALAGEEIDEPDDLFKEIELFQKEQEAKAGGLELVVFGHDTAESISVPHLEIFFEAFRKQVSIFDKMFARRSDYIEYCVEDTLLRGDVLSENFKDFLSHDTAVNLRKPLNKILELGSNEFGFILSCRWIGFQFEVENSFSKEILVSAFFKWDSLKISIRIGKNEIAKSPIPYALLLRDGLPQEALIRTSIEAIFEEIKKQTEKP